MNLIQFRNYIMKALKPQFLDLGYKRRGKCYLYETDNIIITYRFELLNYFSTGDIVCYVSVWYKLFPISYPEDASQWRGRSHVLSKICYCLPQNLFYAFDVAKNNNTYMYAQKYESYRNEFNNFPEIYTDEEREYIKEAYLLNAPISYEQKEFVFKTVFKLILSNHLENFTNFEKLITAINLDKMGTPWFAEDSVSEIDPRGLLKEEKYNVYSRSFFP